MKHLIGCNVEMDIGEVYYGMEAEPGVGRVEHPFVPIRECTWEEFLEWLLATGRTKAQITRIRKASTHFYEISTD